MALKGIGVIFDMDGVLVDSYRAHLESWQSTAAAFGVEMSEEDFSRTFGRTSREVIRQLWPNQFGGEDDATRDRIAALDAKKEQAYRDVLERSFPEMDGASDLIASLHQAGFKLAIGSSAPPKNVEQAKAGLRKGDLFDATVNGAEVIHGKPAPDIFLRAAEKLGLPPARCVVIEDALVGVEAAKRAGMIVIALTGTTPREKLSERADLVIDSLRNLTPEQIAGMVGGREG